MSTPQAISDEDWSLIEDLWKVEPSLDDTIELDDTITEDDETVTLPGSRIEQYVPRPLSTELGQYLSDDDLDEYFVSRDAFPSITHNPDGTANWENIFALDRYIGRLIQPGGDNGRQWTPFGLPPAAWPPLSYSRRSTMEIQPPRATPSPTLIMAPSRPDWTPNREILFMFSALIFAMLLFSLYEP
ncbi:hypothetical protein GHT06_020416 [Daphnia sinensis]|uniref:Uncharacterized protein n=1 Tax=Daphnia sinensis TaxID=1820382 RepID=A0AAD5KJ17_9CRUS|nr:hypothetical protein GHT06_020416 [Daphnia sinensis]